VATIGDMASGMRTTVTILACGVAVALGILGGSFAGNGHHLRCSPQAIGAGAVMFGAATGGILRRNRRLT